MNKRRVLCVWERGSGSGHLFRLSALVQALEEDGCEIVMCVRDERHLRGFVGTERARVIGMPALLKPRLDALSRSHAELLLNLGFGKPLALREYLGRWRQLIAEIRPGAVFCDHADGALIGAYSLNVPAAVIGNAFFHPPAGSALPPYNLGLAVDPQALAQRETDVLRSINVVLKAFGARVLRCFGDLYGYAEQIIASFPELDCYGEREDVGYLGVLGPTRPQAEPIWMHTGQKVFCYYPRGCLPEPDFVNQMRMGGYSLLIAAPGISVANRMMLHRQGVSVSDVHVDLEQVCAECKIVFSEGNHSTTSKMLRCGRPPILLPRQVEQLATARRLADQSLGILPQPSIGEPLYLGLIQKLREDPVPASNAQAFCRRYRNWDEIECMDRLKTTVSRFLRTIEPTTLGRYRL